MFLKNKNLHDMQWIRGDMFFQFHLWLTKIYWDTNSRLSLWDWDKLCNINYLNFVNNIVVVPLVFSPKISNYIPLHPANNASKII